MDQVQFTFPLLLPLHESQADQYQKPQEFNYGPHARHNLDVYLPAGANHDSKHPALFFAYGGGFMQGDKRTSAGCKCCPKLRGSQTDCRTAYQALGDYYSRKGFVTIIVDYRLIPNGAKYPDGAEDLSLAMQWLAKGEIKEADLGNVFFLGASAGSV